MTQLLALSYLLPLLLLMVVLFLVGIFNMGYNIKYAYKSGNMVYIVTVVFVTIVTLIVGWSLGGLIG